MKESAVEFLYARLKADPGKLTIVAIGPLTNIARLLTEHPDCKPWIKRIVLMGGSVRVGYDGKPPARGRVEHQDATSRRPRPCSRPAFRWWSRRSTPRRSLKLEEPLRTRLFAAGTPLTFQVQALYQLWDKPTPIAVRPGRRGALLSPSKFCTMEDLRLEVDDKGFTRVGKGKANARVATAIKADEFLKWYVDRVARRARRCCRRRRRIVSTLIARGGMPNRVHCFEDYETDIEKRWWMSGKAETKNVPPRQQARLPRRADAGLRRPAGRPEDDVHGGHLQPGARPADGQEHAPELPLLAQGHRHAARADLQPDERLSPLPVADGLAAGEAGSRRRWT